MQIQLAITTNVYKRISDNAIAPLGVELGLWEGNYQNQTQIWLRWWDDSGNLLLTGTERAVKLSSVHRTLSI